MSRTEGSNCQELFRPSGLLLGAVLLDGVQVLGWGRRGAGPPGLGGGLPAMLREPRRENRAGPPPLGRRPAPAAGEMPAQAAASCPAGGKCAVAERAPGKCSSPGPGQGRFDRAPPGQAAGRGRSPSPKVQKLQGDPPDSPPNLSSCPGLRRAAPRTFLLRNSLTREAATSSTKRPSMLRPLPARPRPRKPEPLGPLASMAALP